MAFFSNEEEAMKFRKSATALLLALGAASSAQADDHDARFLRDARIQRVLLIFFLP